MSTKPIRIKEESYERLSEFSEENDMEMPKVVAGVLEVIDLSEIEPNRHFTHHVGKCPECNEPVPSSHTHSGILDSGVYATCPEAERLDTEHEAEGVHRLEELREP